MNESIAATICKDKWHVAETMSFSQNGTAHQQKQLHCDKHVASCIILISLQQLNRLGPSAIPR
jgi:hypothetical protein